MQAERDFINSLDEKTFTEIRVACVNRLFQESKYMKKDKSALNIAKDCVAAYTQEVSISSIACRPCALESGYGIPSTTQEAPQQKGQKEDTMSDLEVARRHMDNRLYGIKNDKRAALKTQFGLASQLFPLTFADMKARLLAGQFTLPTDEDQEWNVSLDGLEWRDPSVKKDRPGFDAAEKLLDAAALKVKDAIWVKANAEDALSLLEAFESSTVN